MPTLDIIIVNWNAGHHLYDCLNSIPQARLDTARLHRVVVVDNASSDHSLTEIENLDLPLMVLRNGTNRGFAAACNQGAAHSDADFLLFLNPDTRLHASSIEQPVAFLERTENQHVGICGIRLLDELHRPTTACARFPSLRIFVGETTRLNLLAPHLFPRHFLSPGELTTSMPVDQVMGAFFLVRRDVFEELGGFDERFFVYYEEVDLSLRAKQMGFVSYFLAEATAFHKGGGTSEQVPAQRLFYSLRSRLLYAHKHFSRPSFLLLLLYTLGPELIIRCMAHLSSLQTLSGTLRGYLLLIRSFLPNRQTSAHSTTAYS